MKRTGMLLLLAALSIAATPPARSGPLGIYGIIERVVFEPNEQAPERVQLWGAFAYVDAAGGNGLVVSPAARGYLYFQLPAMKTDSASVRLVRTEWADLKAVAGTASPWASGGGGTSAHSAGSSRADAARRRPTSSSAVHEADR